MLITKSIVEITELPYVFRTTLANIPAEVPYIHVEPASLPRDARIKVGLIWQSGDWDERRSVPFSEIRRLAELPGIAWHILQREAASAGWDGQFGTIAGGEDPLGDARVMQALDLIISVDTMTAHLAGALGRNTWTLLPADADWRWMLKRDRQSVVSDDASVSTARGGKLARCARPGRQGVGDTRITSSCKSC